MKNDKIKIYVSTHKQYDMLNNDLYTPIFCGAVNKDSFGYLRDDIGDNISDKNPVFSELTGLYWIWKNSDDDIVGLNHYRRYLVNGYYGFGDPINKNEILDALDEADVITYKKRKYGLHTYDIFRLFISKEDFQTTCDVFKEVHPDYYKTFKDVLLGKEIYPYSIFVARKEWFDNYCSWLFSFLFKLENALKEKNGVEPERMIGYVAEILLIVYIKQNNFKTKEFYLNVLEAKSSFLTNLIDTNHVLSYIFYRIPTLIHKK